MATYDFARLADIERIAGDKFDEVVRGTLLDLSRRIIVRTPVDSGRARGNWQVTYGGPAGGTLPTEDPSGSATIAEAAKMTELAGGNVWYLTNNLPYVGPKLEYGYSGQAPSGMVRISLAELDQSIKEQISRLK